VWPAVTEW